MSAPSVPDVNPGGADVAKCHCARLQTEFDILVVAARVEIGKIADGVDARTGDVEAEADPVRQIGNSGAIRRPRGVVGETRILLDGRDALATFALGKLVGTSPLLRKRSDRSDVPPSE